MAARKVANPDQLAQPIRYWAFRQWTDMPGDVHEGDGIAAEARTLSPGVAPRSDVRAASEEGGTSGRPRRALSRLYALAAVFTPGSCGGRSTIVEGAGATKMSDDPLRRGTTAAY